MVVVLYFIMLFVFSFFFFFQAEDGIRDLTVTGVQTVLFRSSVPADTTLMIMSSSSDCFSGFSTVPRAPTCLQRSLLSARSAELTIRITAPASPASRSEERRVGKECRSRWSPYE